MYLSICIPKHFVYRSWELGKYLGAASHMKANVVMMIMSRKFEFLLYSCHSVRSYKGYEF